MSDTKLNHPCKETCSGWQQGYEAGEKSSEERLKKYEVALDRIGQYETLENGDKYVNHEQGWHGVARFAREALAVLKGNP